MFLEFSGGKVCGCECVHANLKPVIPSFTVGIWEGACGKFIFRDFIHRHFGLVGLNMASESEFGSSIIMIQTWVFPGKYFESKAFKHL